MPTIKMNPLVRWAKNISLSGAALFVGTAFAWAADRYVLDVPAFVMAGDPEIFFTVTPLSEGVEDTASHTVRFVDLPVGVQVEDAGPSPRTAGTQTRFAVEGRKQFKLVVPPSVAERRIWVKVQNNANARVQGAGVVNVERPVHRFTLTPLGKTAPQAGVPFLFQIMAFDEAGAVVRSFQGSVSLGVTRGQVTPSEVAGNVFEKGTASVNVVFSDGDLFEPNRLTVTAQSSYESFSPAQGAVDVLVLPGETP